MKKFAANDDLAAALLRGTSGMAHAQDTANNQAAASPAAAGDIVMTAQRREQSVMKVPLASSAIKGDTLQSNPLQSTRGMRPPQVDTQQRTEK
jgi:iron complex outermembrane recepter protein